MKTKVIRSVEMDTDVDIHGITLLSVEEAKRLSQDVLSIDCCWWLRSPGYRADFVAMVDFDGSVCVNGYCVNYYIGAVRPALIIRNLKIGDKLTLFGYDWTVVLDDLALCDTGICYHMFDRDSNNWETSELKAWLENWLKEKNKWAI